MRLADYPFPAYPPAGKPPVDNPEGRWPFANKQVSNGLRDATISGEPYPIKAWVVYACNVGMTMPNPPETRKAADNLDLLVVIDTHPSDTAGYADVVLPDTVYLERHDDFYMGSGRQGWAALRQPVVEPPGDQRPAWWIAKQLSQRLGVDEYMPFEDMDEYLAKRCELSGIDYDEFRKKGIMMGPKQPTTIEEGAKISFDTPSKKVEFYSDQLAEAGFDPVPKYTATGRRARGLLPPRHRARSDAQLQQVADQSAAAGADGPERGLGERRYRRHTELENGQYVVLKNQDGVASSRVRVKVTQRIRPDTVYLVHGFGHKNPMLKGAYLNGASTLTSTRATRPIR